MTDPDNRLREGKYPRPPETVKLAAWLDYIQGLHPKTWDLTLDRVAAVARRMSLERPAKTVFIVGGTNGKGSVSTYIDALLRATGQSVGLTLSPHFNRFNERFLVDGLECKDEDIVEALKAIETARGETSLSYFEFSALAALYLFREAAVDACVLEVGLGGRFDAMNVVEPDVAVITRVALDHTGWLGDTREVIGLEKAGILRNRKPAVIGDPDPPSSVIQEANRIGAHVIVQNREFGVDPSGGLWFTDPGGARHTLPTMPQAHLPVQNAATALQAFVCSGGMVSHKLVAGVIANTTLRGRLEYQQWQLPRSGAGLADVPDETRDVLLDVAHNPDSAEYLAKHLEQSDRRIHAVFACYGDKDAGGVVKPLLPAVDGWFLPDVGEPRALAAPELAGTVTALGGEVVGCYPDVPSALAAAAPNCDLVLVFGSFSTVAGAMRVLDANRRLR